VVSIASKKGKNKGMPLILPSADEAVELATMEAKAGSEAVDEIVVLTDHEEERLRRAQVSVFPLR
jgi:hypothetical protein